MINNIIEITTDNKELSSYRGFLRIKEKGEIVQDLSFDSIHSIFITGHGIIYTSNLLQSLCEYGIPLIVCGKNFLPCGMLISLIGQQSQMDIQHTQINTTKPFQKQLWAEIVKEKIKNQSRVLDLFKKVNKIKTFHNEVLSGDSKNIEGVAARLYFPNLFGDDFIRDTDKIGVNSFLNYGYAIIRATVARFVVASGLNPSFGIKHHNKLNPFCLVDDLMEIYRPVVDVKVYQIFNGTDELKELTPEYKKVLSEIIHMEIFNGKGFSELISIIQNDIWNFVASLKEKKNKLNFNKYLIKK